ncbi:hypothetical protein WMY93_007619 [Mugilogobius chulae]|uniref:Uncharacterized protein n=1 Tax=Mugilogobius chulae TaxID=88201 RepID=A0AAW0PDH6_9GOBI
MQLTPLCYRSEPCSCSRKLAENAGALQLSDPGMGYSTHASLPEETTAAPPPRCAVTPLLLLLLELSTDHQTHQTTVTQAVPSLLPASSFSFAEMSTNKSGSGTSSAAMSQRMVWVDLEASAP